MNPEENDAAVYGPDGLIANAKIFLNINGNETGNIEIRENTDKPIYIIANSCHSLGFLVISKDEPIGFNDPGFALSNLERLRKDQGLHINLYRAEPVKGPVIRRKDMEKIIKDLAIKDFEYSLVSEYLG